MSDRVPKSWSEQLDQPLWGIDPEKQQQSQGKRKGKGKGKGKSSKGQSGTSNSQTPSTSKSPVPSKEHKELDKNRFLLLPDNDSGDMEFDGAHPRAPSPLRPLKEQDMEIRVSPGSRTQSPSPSRGRETKIQANWNIFVLHDHE